MDVHLNVFQQDEEICYCASMTHDGWIFIRFYANTWPSHERIHMHNIPFLDYEFIIMLGFFILSTCHTWVANKLLNPLRHERYI
jgi:hypothetical protein